VEKLWNSIKFNLIPTQKCICGVEVAAAGGRRKHKDIQKNCNTFPRVATINFDKNY